MFEHESGKEGATSIGVARKTNRRRSAARLMRDPSPPGTPQSVCALDGVGGPGKIREKTRKTGIPGTTPVQPRSGRGRLSA